MRRRRSISPLREHVGIEYAHRTASPVLARSHAAEKDTTACPSGTLGAELVELRLSLLPQALAMHRVIQLVEASQAHAPWFDDQRERYAEPVRRLLEAGYLVPATRCLQAQQARRLLVEDFDTAMDGLDALLAPSTPITAPRRDADPLQTRPLLLACTIAISQIGWPALSIPIGSDAGLPFGLQIVSRPFSEPLLLRLGAALER